MRRPDAKLALLALGGLMALTAATAAYAGKDDPRVRIGRVEVDGSQITLTFQLEKVFDDNLKRRIDSGLVTGFTFQLRLARPHKWRIDKTLESSSLRVEAMYNAVTREYLINYRQDGNLIESRVVREADELRRAMTEFDSFPAFSIADRPADKRLQVRLRAELGTRTVFFFIPRTYSTDWVGSRKFTIAKDDG